MEDLPHEKPIQEYLGTINRLKEQSASNPIFASEIGRLEAKLEDLKEAIYGELSPQERVQISRHPKRPHALDYIHALSDDFLELHGDRNFADDGAIVGGLATIKGQRFVVIGQEKGNDTDSRLARNFGMPHPEGYRKALRLAELAERFDLPILTLIDTAGAYPGLGAEERGQAWAIAENLQKFSQIQVPIIVVIIGEGCSGGAIGIGVGDSVAMLEHSYYSVISPEGCASILWKDASKRDLAAESLKLNAEDLLEAKVIEAIIKEPLGGAHHDWAATFQAVQEFILQELAGLQKVSKKLLLEQRYIKFRKIGQSL